MDRVERFWLGVSNAVSEFIIDRVESGHAAAAGEDLATYRTRVYGDAGGGVALIEQGKPLPKVSLVPAVHRRAPVAVPEKSLGELAFERVIAEDAERERRLLMSVGDPERAIRYPGLPN